MNIDEISEFKTMYISNPTCHHCGMIYGVAEIHNCFFKQEALRKQKEAAIAKSEKELADAAMSTRDQFAAAALNGLCGLSWRSKSTSEPTPKDHAELAYQMADAMMIARVKG